MFTTSASGTGEQVKEQLKQHGDQFASTDGENEQTKVSRRLSAATSAAVEKLVDGKDGSSFSVSVSGSQNEGGTGYLNISISESKAAASEG